jgi:hypothetical protein
LKSHWKVNNNSSHTPENQREEGGKGGGEEREEGREGGREGREGKRERRGRKEQGVTRKRTYGNAAKKRLRQYKLQ